MYFKRFEQSVELAVVNKVFERVRKRFAEAI